MDKEKQEQTKVEIKEPQDNDSNKAAGSSKASVEHRSQSAKGLKSKKSTDKEKNCRAN